MSFLAAILLLTSCGNSRAFNVDTTFPVRYTGPNDSYFGYTVALHRNERGPTALVGAPKANSTTLEDPIFEPGALFRCNITDDGIEDGCRELALLKEGNTFTWDRDEFSYKERKDGMWLGVSLDVRQSTTQNDTVVCGHLWRNQLYSQRHFVNGICYVIDTDLNEDNARKLIPLVQKSGQFGSYYGNTEYNFAFGQAGISAAFSQDASNLILGSPGIFSWTGSLVNYPVYPGSTTALYNNPSIPRPSQEVNYNSYFGYSVTSGIFIRPRDLLYAVGAPRDGENRGMVYIVRGAGQRISIKGRKWGDQLGEYFGASVLGVDLNGDSFTDLLVGAPMYSLEFEGDEGKVYVYVSNGKDLQKFTELAGERKASARFGTAIANIGDINQDGFTDIAIGAPYEDGHGAVYIYHGSLSGLNSRYEQKIAAASIDGKLLGFGIHISRGLDIDDNGYPDFLVGSYASSNAVLFRSRPVIHVISMLNFNPKQILMDVPCETGRNNLTCIQVDACLNYTGQHLPTSLEFQITLTIQDHRRRGFFVEDASEVVQSRNLILVPIKTMECFAFRMFLNAVIRDFITPIQVEFSHSLKMPNDFDQYFHKTFPIYHPSSLTNITSHIPFYTGCGKADECHSNLKVSVKRLEPSESVEFITLGTVSSISVEITVENKGEPAYLTELEIYLPPELPSINQDKCENRGQQRNVTLTCDTENPLKRDTQAKIYIKLDTTKIPPHTKYLAIVFKVTTISTETDPDDNIATLPIFPETAYDIGVTGFSSVDQVMYSGRNMTSPTIITHTYIVKNYGPSPLKIVHFSLRMPYELSTSDGFVQIVSFIKPQTEQRTQSSVPVTCDYSSLNITAVETPVKQKGKPSKDIMLTEVEGNLLNSTASRKNVQPPSDLKMAFSTNKNRVQSGKENGEKTNTPKKRTIAINCASGNIRCINLRCTATAFSNPRKYAEISVPLYINFTVLNKYMGSWYHIELVTRSSISVKEGEVMKENIYPDVAQVKTDLYHEGPPPPKEMESWIIFVSIGVGILLLILILILFIKIGFFRRKEKDKMNNLLAQENVPEEKEVEATDSRISTAETDSLS